MSVVSIVSTVSVVSVVSVVSTVRYSEYSEYNECSEYSEGRRQRTRRFGMSAHTPQKSAVSSRPRHELALSGLLAHPSARMVWSPHSTHAVEVYVSVGSSGAR